MLASLQKNIMIPFWTLCVIFLSFVLLKSNLPKAIIYLILTVSSIIFLIALCIKIYINGLKTKYELEALKNNAISTKNEILASEAKILKRISLIDPSIPERKPSDALLAMRKDIANSENKILEQITEINKKEFENFPIFNQ